MRQSREKKAFINISPAKIDLKKKKIIIKLLAGVIKKRSHFSEVFNQIERNCFKIVHRKYISEESERERKGERSVWGERQWKVFDFFFFFLEVF